ncbi:hypothetical protein NUW54_g7114 [Trametes sanguinea]|uniref:Uncharacterized protein n=1 Tax=Trametes sanguinea TaxID=158606 RepID=A0ACC1PNL1_9APHY|nr:hypothetical protein NUW54_g7114 [Trametes sanguinea]
MSLAPSDIDMSVVLDGPSVPKLDVWCAWKELWLLFLAPFRSPVERTRVGDAGDPVVPDYTKALNANALRGARLGVPRKFLTLINLDDARVAAFNASLEIMRAKGATIVDPADFPDTEELLASNNETVVLSTDFKVDVEKYIAGLVEVPTGVKTLADLIAFNIAHANEELVPPFWTDQSQ